MAYWSHRARLVLGLMTTFGGYTIPLFIQTTQPAIPPWVSAMSTGGSFSYRLEETASSA